MKDCKTLKDNYDDCRFVTARYDEEACVSFYNIWAVQCTVSRNYEQHNVVKEYEN